jgi:hypothetical protein
MRSMRVSMIDQGTKYGGIRIGNPELPELMDIRRKEVHGMVLRPTSDAIEVHVLTPMRKGLATYGVVTWSGPSSL